MLPSAGQVFRRVIHRAKRWLYVLHRWIGIASCLFFAMWFLSGLVMIYVPYPALTRAEQLEGLTDVDWPLVRVSPGPALSAAGIATAPRRFLLEMRGSSPVWRITPETGTEIDISATTGKRIGLTDAIEARRNAAMFALRPVTDIVSIERDQWTVAGRYDAHRPLWKATLGGPGERVLYVSSRTGAVVLDTNRYERFWNWLGSVPHWLYPTVLRQDNAAWRQVVMWVSGPCIVAAITGFWIGIIRTRLGRRRFKHDRMTPYRGWMHWHHIAGLVGGIFLIAWIFSGWLSVDPFRLFASKGIGDAARSAYARAGTPPAIGPDLLADIGAGTKQVELQWLAGRAMTIVSRADGMTAVFDAATLDPVRLDTRAIVTNARVLVPGAQIAEVERLTAPDSYWYEVGGLPALPVLRIKFDDAAQTWVHIDPATGIILGDIDARRRLYRWLFDLFHKWDFNLLTLNRPLWDIVLWGLSFAGLITSISGIRIGWARLRRRTIAQSET